MSSSDPAVNGMWNDVNNTFNRFVTAELESSGWRAVAMLHPVEARDTNANVERLMKRASTDRCDTLVDVSMFADQTTQKFVTRMRVFPIVLNRVQGPPGGTNYIVGAESFAKEQADPLTKETLDRLVPSEFAKSFVAEFLSSKPR